MLEEKLPLYLEKASWLMDYWSAEENATADEEFVDALIQEAGSEYSLHDKVGNAAIEIMSQIEEVINYRVKLNKRIDDGYGNTTDDFKLDKLFIRKNAKYYLI